MKVKHNYFNFNALNMLSILQQLISMYVQLCIYLIIYSNNKIGSKEYKIYLEVMLQDQ